MVGLVLTGTRAAGKTALATALHQHDRTLTPVPAVTTRPRRSDDRPGAYTHLSRGDFGELAEGGSLLVRSRYGDHDYGIAAEEVTRVLGSGRRPVLTVTPEAALRIVCGPERGAWLGAFVDAHDATLDLRLLARGAPADHRRPAPASGGPRPAPSAAAKTGQRRDAGRGRKHGDPVAARTRLATRRGPARHGSAKPPQPVVPGVKEGPPRHDRHPLPWPLPNAVLARTSAR